MASVFLPVQSPGPINVFDQGQPFHSTAMELIRHW